MAKLTSIDLEIEIEISELGEFLYDDYGGTVEQLGAEKTRELEERYKFLQARLRESYKEEERQAS